MIDRHNRSMLDTWRASIDKNTDEFRKSEMTKQDFQRLLLKIGFNVHLVYILSNEFEQAIQHKAKQVFKDLMKELTCLTDFDCKRLKSLKKKWGLEE